MRSGVGSAVSSTHFSTSDLPVLDRFDAWRDKISVIFDVDRIGGPSPTWFEANVDAYQIGNLVITDSTQGEQAYSLSAKRARSADIDLAQLLTSVRHGTLRLQKILLGEVGGLVRLKLIWQNPVSNRQICAQNQAL